MLVYFMPYCIPYGGVISDTWLDMRDWSTEVMENILKNRLNRRYLNFSSSLGSKIQESQVQ